jgi:hypothetical protein
MFSGIADDGVDELVRLFVSGLSYVPPAGAETA